MGNCALKPKVLMKAGGAPAPEPEELQISLLEDQKKVDAAKSLSNLFLQDKAEKKTTEDDRTTPENIPVTDDLKTALADANSPTKEIKSPIKETKSPVTETNVPDDDEKVMNEETVREEKVIDDVTVKEIETETKPEEEVRKEAAAP